MMSQQTVLTCEAEGNPEPRYQWLQKMPTQTVLRRGFEKTLVIDSVSYDDQGEFVCEAVNAIGGELRPVQSDAITVRVSGAPQVMRLRGEASSSVSGEREVSVRDGEPARLAVTFCADPPPKQTWHLGELGGGVQHSVILSAGTQHSRFTAEEMEPAPDGRDNCYVSALTINGAHADDARKYELKLENEHGSDSHVVTLVVRSEF